MKIILNKNLGEEYEDEIEKIFKTKSIISGEEMVFKGANIASIPFTSNEERISWIEENAILLKDENYYYVASIDEAGDWVVERCNLHNGYLDAVDNTEVNDEIESSIDLLNGENNMKNIIGKIIIKKENVEADVTFEVIPATEWSQGHKKVDCDLASGFIPFSIKEEVNEEVIKKLLHNVAKATLEEKVNFLDGELTGLTFEEIGLPNPVGEDEEGKDEIKEVETFLNCLHEDVFIEKVHSVKNSLMEWAIQFFGIEFVPPSDSEEEKEVVEKSTTSKGSMKVLNAFSLNMIEGDADISIRQIGWDEADKIIKNGQSCIGHDDLANLVGMPANRCTLTLKKGEKVLVVQYTGPRLPEGCTTLPEGAKLVPKIVEVL